MKTRRAGHIDLCHAVANHVQAHQQQTACRQNRPQSVGYRPVRFAQWQCHAFTAYGQIATHFATLWDTCQAKRHGLAPNDQYAFVAFGNGGQKLLHHHGLGSIPIQRLDDAAQVEAIFLYTKYPHAAHAVQWLEDDVLVLGVEAFDGLCLARDQSRADELGKLQDRQLFGVVAQSPRLVKHLGTLPLGLLQQVGGVKELAVKGRVFAHDHSAKIFDSPLGRSRFREPDRRIAREGNGTHLGNHHCAALPTQLLRLASDDAMTTALGLAHHRKRRVFVNLERFEGVADKKDFHGVLPIT